LHGDRSRDLPHSKPALFHQVFEETVKCYMKLILEK